MEAYRPIFTWARFSESNIRFLNQLSYSQSFTMRGVVALWAVLLAVGLFRFRDPRWILVGVWVMVAPLPISFLPDRGGPQLYIVLAGWSLAAALACRVLVRGMAWALKPVGLPRKEYVAAGFVLCAGAYAQETLESDRDAKSGFQENGKQTLEILEDLKASQLRPRPGSRIVFLTDPFPGSFNMQFLASLLWNDHSLDIALQNQIHFRPETLEHTDYLLDYTDGRFVVRKAPR
jgi:hypothetical protein